MAPSSFSFCYSAVVLLCLCTVASAQLSPTFYNTSCPNVLSTIQTGIQAALQADSRMGASLLRMHFHDCFVQGCDGSVLLDDTANFTGEKTAFPNNNSLRGFEVIDALKSSVEALCPGVVSCADILAVAARDSVVALGGPTWTVPLGRRDSTTANISLANTNLPAPTLNLSDLITSFANQGLTTAEMVALSGGHTIGLARCVSYRDHIYNDSNINANYSASLRAICPFSSGDDVLAPLDVATNATFDNRYYTNLLSNQGLLHSDQELFNGGSTDAQVTSYTTNSTAFFADFTSAMIKMSSIGVVTGTSGQIRTSCRRVN
ncbi:Cationic peroxidase 1 [Nymphaea thermarum]|nr:Cationic peroxidase 1 [Nymphaea thermarum]